MTKVVPIIVANNIDDDLLSKHNAIERLTEIVDLRNRNVYQPAFLLSTVSTIPTIHNVATKKAKLDFDHIYGCEGFEVSMFAVLAAAKIANEKYPGSPIMMLKSTMRRDMQGDHTRDVKANISDAKLGHIITFSSPDHFFIDAMFTYEGLHKVCSMLRDEIIDIEAHWPEYAKARDHSRGRIAKGPIYLSDADAHEMLEFKIRTKEVSYTDKKPEFYTPWKTYDAVTAFSA